MRRELYWSGWWIPFSVMGWVTGLTLPPGLLLTGTMAGLLTGIALEVLLRQPGPRATSESGSIAGRLGPSRRKAP